MKTRISLLILLSGSLIAAASVSAQQSSQAVEAKPYPPTTRLTPDRHRLAANAETWRVSSRLDCAEAIDVPRVHAHTVKLRAMSERCDEHTAPLLSAIAGLLVKTDRA